MPGIDFGIGTNAPDYRRLVITQIDSRGDQRSTSYRLSATATDAAINGLVNALSSASNAYTYRAQVVSVWETNRLASSANDAVFTSVHQNVVISVKDTTTGLQQSAYIPAPLGAIVDDGELVDITNAEYVAFRSALLTVIDGAPQTARFTERRDKNDSVPAN